MLIELMSRALTISAPAKLNLALSVGPPDKRGMHAICSWMVTVDLCDVLTVTRLEDDRLSRYAILWHAEAGRRSEIDWPVTKDLAVRAHLALERHVGRHLPVQLKLEKRIPVGGGLGGGSSDAAAMLHAVNKLHELGLSLSELQRIGGTLGSDVPFLVRGGSAIVEGLGERIESHAQLLDLHAVLAFPDTACPTGAVYAMFDQLGNAGTAALRREAVMKLISAQPLRPESLFNDLARAAMRIAPPLENSLAGLSDLAGRPAHVTGSGSTIFVVCDSQVEAQHLAEAVERRLHMPAVAVRTCGGPAD